MIAATLASLRHRVALGVPLPFSILSADHRLLLARGHCITDPDMLRILIERGAVVDTRELTLCADDVHRAGATELPRLWSRCMEGVRKALRDDPESNFVQSLDAVAKPVLALIQRDPDLAVFNVLRQDTADADQYGVKHAVHSATAAHLASRRLGASDVEALRAFRAALTMNLAILDLQSKLSVQRSPLTPDQREQINQHPSASRDLLASRGIDDSDWLRAVAEHHERTDGSGYPHRLREVSELAQLVAAADVYTAKLSARATRRAMPADQAARAFFQASRQSSAAAAIVKEFGVFPPGTFVKLSNGEAGVVVKRGATTNDPVVSVVLNRRGEPVLDPLRRKVGEGGLAVSAVVTEASLPLRLSQDRLAALMQAA